jgi:hypothetical protein
MDPALDTPIAEVQGATQAGGSIVIRRMVTSMAWDLGPSVAAYYSAQLVGCSHVVSLLAGAVASALRLVWVAAHSRRIDPFALFLMVLFGVGLALTFITGDVRFALLKDSLTSFLAGVFFLGSCAVHRPMAYSAAQRFAGPAGAAQVRARYLDPLVRHRYYLSSLVWGGGLLAEALLRVPLVFLLPFNLAVVASNVLMVLTYTVLIIWTIRSLKRSARA